MKVFYSFNETAEFSEYLNRIKTNFDPTDERQLEWIAEQCVDFDFSATEPEEDLPKVVKLWRKNGEELGKFSVVIEQRPVLQARIIKDNSLD